MMSYDQMVRMTEAIRDMPYSENAVIVAMREKAGELLSALIDLEADYPETVAEIRAMMEKRRL